MARTYRQRLFVIVRGTLLNGSYRVYARTSSNGIDPPQAIDLKRPCRTCSLPTEPQYLHDVEMSFTDV